MGPFISCSADNADKLSALKGTVDEFYVNADQILLSDGGIFVNIDDLGFIPVAAVFFDSSGRYFVQLDRDPQCGHTVYCPVCRGCYPGNQCQHRCKCREYPR